MVATGCQGLVVMSLYKLSNQIRKSVVHLSSSRPDLIILSFDVIGTESMYQYMFIMSK